MYKNRSYIAAGLQKKIWRLFRLYRSLLFKKLSEAYTRASPQVRAIQRFCQIHFLNRFTFIKILDRYIVLEVLSPFFVALLFFICISISTAFRESLGDLIAKDIDPWIIFSFFLSAIIEQLPTVLPPTIFFSSLLAARRLSGDQELTAMRSLGMGYGRIYFSFVILGFFLCLCMALVTFSLGPKSKKYRRSLTSTIYHYQSIAFVKAGHFFNRPAEGGENIDIYAEGRDDSSLKNLYIHRWSIYPHLGSKRIPQDEGDMLVGASQTDQIIFAKEGNLIERPVSSSLAVEEIQKKKQDIEKVKLPRGLADRSLLDLGFMLKLPEIEDTKERRKYMRLKKGFTIQLNPERTKVQVNNFQAGLMDYSLAPPAKKLFYFSISISFLTLWQLIEINHKIENGGLVIDPNFIYSDKEVSQENYIEIARKELLPLLKPGSSLLVQLSPEEIYDKYGLYIPMEKDTPEKRQAHFNYIHELGSYMLQKQPEIIYSIHQRISLTLSVFFFLLIAFPLGVGAERSGKGASFSLALFFYLSHTILLRVLNVMFEEGELGPVLTAWLPQVILFLATLFALFRSQESRQILLSILRSQQK